MSRSESGRGHAPLVQRTEQLGPNERVAGPIPARGTGGGPPRGARDERGPRLTLSIGRAADGGALLTRRSHGASVGSNPTCSSACCTLLQGQREPLTRPRTASIFPLVLSSLRLQDPTSAFNKHMRDQAAISRKAERLHGETPLALADSGHFHSVLPER